MKNKKKIFSDILVLRLITMFEIEITKKPTGNLDKTYSSKMAFSQ